MGIHRGKFITLEGIEGCGKSTQHGLLAQWLRISGLTVVATKQPGGTGIGTQIREILLHADHHNMTPACEAMLYMADRAQHHKEIIQPALEQGSWVVCDRYQDSTLAYQGAARGLDQCQLDAMFGMATNHLFPDLTLLLDMDPAKGLARARARNIEEQSVISEGRFEQEALLFHARVRASYLDLRAEDSQRIVKIEADKPEAEVADSIRQIITSRWSLNV